MRDMSNFHESPFLRAKSTYSVHLSGCTSLRVPEKVSRSSWKRFDSAATTTGIQRRNTKAKTTQSMCGPRYGLSESGASTRSAGSHHRVNHRPRPGPRIPHAEVKMISRRDAMIRSERTGEAAEHDLRVRPRTHAKRHTVPGKPSTP